MAIPFVKDIKITMDGSFPTTDKLQQKIISPYQELSPGTPVDISFYKKRPYARHTSMELHGS
jgi:hypothetical protein